MRASLDRAIETKAKLAILAVIAMSAFAGIALAQGERVVVVGRVTDPGGGVIPGAEVSLKRVSTNELFTELTNEAGDFAFRAMLPEIYDMKVGMAGFKTELRPQLKLEVGRTYRIDFRLSVGQVSEQIEVLAEAPILKTENPELTQVIDNKKIIGLPLNNRDIFGTLGGLTPGLQPTRRGGVAINGGIQFNVKGLRQGDNMGMIDGSMVSETNGSSQFNINPDAVQEFEIKTGLYGADYGVKPGGQFSIVTKSGTNELHGTVFWLHRNDNFDARNFFDPGARPEFKRNQFGAVAGGPMSIPGLFNGKDKAWWFVSYSGQRVRQLLSLTATVPTAAEKQGIFSTPIVDINGQAFPNNTIPSNRLNPVAQKFLSFWPEPNTSGRGFNFTSSSSGNQDSDQLIARVDFREGQSSRWSARFIYDHRPILFANAVDAFTVTNQLDNYGQNITNTRTFKGKVVNEFGLHFYRRPYFPGSPPGGPEDFGSSLPITGFPTRPIDYTGTPVLGITGYAGLGSRSLLGPVPEGQWEVKDGASWTKGSHLMKAGYHHRRHFFVELLDFRSSFSFTNDRFTRNSFANFLLGYLTSTNEADERRMNTYFPAHYFFFQDNWKISQRLSVMLGLRYELRTAWKDKRGYLSNLEVTCVNSNPAAPIPACFDPPLAIANPVPPATGRFEDNTALFDWTRNGWQPRLGFSYRLGEKTVLRGGGGIYGNEPYGGMVDGGLIGNPRPNAVQRSFLAGLDVPLDFSDPFNVSGQTAAVIPNGAGFQDPLPQWNIYNWGLSIQRELTKRSVLEVGYQGSRGVHEIQVTEFNDALPGPGARQSRRPFSGLQRYALMLANGDRNYNGLEVRYEQRPGPEGLTTLLAYTWSKSLDTIGGRLGVPGDPGGISRNVTNRQNYGRGEADITGRFSAMVGYDIPFGPGQLHSGGTLGKIFGGWSVNGILSLQKGQYLTAVTTDLLDVGSAASQRPQLVSDPDLPSDERTPARWFNTAAFTTPQQYQYGNAGRGIIEGPGLANLDLAVLRNFVVSERMRVEFRFEAFNVTNHTNFNVPATTFGNSTFGVIGAAFEARDLQFGLKIYY